MSEELEFDPEAQADETRQAQLLEQLADDKKVAQLRTLLQSEEVRDLLWSIIEHCHVYAAVFNRSFGDMALQEGARQVGLWLLASICEADPTAEMRMRRKALDVAHAKAQRERERRERRRRPASSP